MEIALEEAVQLLENRIIKLQTGSQLSFEVHSQEISRLEEAVAALKWQQRGTHDRILTEFPALEDSAGVEIAALHKGRENLLRLMTKDGDRMLEDLRSFLRARERARQSAVPSETIKDGCSELWASLSHVRETRLYGSLSLAEKLKDALTEARRAIDESRTSRMEGETAVEEMIHSLRREALRDLESSRRRREEAEEHILQLLEQSCVHVETAMFSDGAHATEPGISLT